MLRNIKSGTRHVAVLAESIAGRFGQRRLLGTSGVLNYQGRDIKLGGAGVIIEIDECKIGKWKFHKGAPC